MRLYFQNPCGIDIAHVIEKQNGWLMHSLRLPDRTQMALTVGIC